MLDECPLLGFFAVRSGCLCSGHMPTSVMAAIGQGAVGGHHPVSTGMIEGRGADSRLLQQLQSVLSEVDASIRQTCAVIRGGDERAGSGIFDGAADLEPMMAGGVREVKHGFGFIAASIDFLDEIPSVVIAIHGEPAVRLRNIEWWRLHCVLPKIQRDVDSIRCICPVYSGLRDSVKKRDQLRQRKPARSCSDQPRPARASVSR